jgi:hypothetical protein
MSQTKVMLSPTELELVNNSDWILTKNAVIGKVYTLFGDLSEVYQTELAKKSFLTAGQPGFRSPKIARGEQYQGLPWVMLDYPRQFSTNDTFAIRSFFWWGNFCSITLQLSGIFCERYADAIQQYFDTNPELRKNWYIGKGDDAWQHHFEEDNYQPLEEYTHKNFATIPFIKLAKKISLQDWNLLPDFFENNFRKIIEMLAINNF